MRQAAPIDSTTQMMATMELLFIIEGFSMDMKRTMMWGMPK